MDLCTLDFYILKVDEIKLCTLDKYAKRICAHLTGTRNNFVYTWQVHETNLCTDDEHTKRICAHFMRARHESVHISYVHETNLFILDMYVKRICAHLTSTQYEFVNNWCGNVHLKSARNESVHTLDKCKKWIASRLTPVVHEANLCTLDMYTKRIHAQLICMQNEHVRIHITCIPSSHTTKCKQLCLLCLTVPGNITFCILCSMFIEKRETVRLCRAGKIKLCPVAWYGKLTCAYMPSTHSETVHIPRWKERDFLRILRNYLQIRTSQRFSKQHRLYFKGIIWGLERVCLLKSPPIASRYCPFNRVNRGKRAFFDRHT